MPGFALHSFAATRQAPRAPGFLAGQTLAELAERTFWTLTLWENEQAMRAFMTSGAHQRAMPHLADWCDEAGVAHWPADALPAWPEAQAALRERGRPSRLRHPSARHPSLDVPPPRAPRIQALTPRGGRKKP